MVVDIAGRFVTQRTEPRLASIATAITATSLILTVPGAEPLQVPLDQSGVASAVTVWRDTVPGIDQGPAAAAGFRRAWPVLTGWFVRFRGTTACNPNTPERPARTPHSPMAIRCWCCPRRRWTI